MRHGLRTRRGFPLAIAALLAATVAEAGEPAPPAPVGQAGESEQDARALAVLQRMASYLSDQTTGAVTVGSTYDVVQPDGEKLEFAETRRIVWRRPDGLRVDAVAASGERNEVVYDGRQIAVAHPSQHAWTSVPVPSDLDAALDRFTVDLGMRFPLKELLSSDLPGRLPTLVREARFVGEEVIDGRANDHVAVRGPDTDVQVWVPKQGVPVPSRIVITYRDEPGQPQYRASFRDFDACPEIGASTFAFEPPPGAERLAIVVPPEPARGEP